jgi:hypothetical protein
VCCAYGAPLYEYFAKLGPLGYQDVRPMNDYLNIVKDSGTQDREFNNFVLNCIFDRGDCANTTGSAILEHNQKYGNCYSFGTS